MTKYEDLPWFFHLKRQEDGTVRFVDLPLDHPDFLRVLGQDAMPQEEEDSDD